MIVKWNWRKSRFIFLQENEHLVMTSIDLQTINYTINNNVHTHD